eukprot:TRINITY_DN9925_c0_g1_i1.p1 TRINITY_DN9925_c0_g1~~TRINITY_DN9925_c0_g1_i1.p1  ORF type:complete len:230 (-),score=31.07 TRINITY_DN9925_c0_g1_i1:197-886(-)
MCIRDRVITVLYYNVNNLEMGSKEILQHKNITVEELKQEIINNKIFDTFIQEDLLQLDLEEVPDLRFITQDKQKKKIVKRPNYNTMIAPVLQKYTLRVEIETEPFNSSEQFDIFCAHYTKTNDLISSPFILVANKTDTIADIKLKLFSVIERHNVYIDRQIQINMTYFKKLKIEVFFRTQINNNGKEEKTVIEEEDKVLWDPNRDQALEIGIYHPHTISQANFPMKIWA